jgi:hypothetical protein
MTILLLTSSISLAGAVAGRLAEAEAALQAGQQAAGTTQLLQLQQAKPALTLLPKRRIQRQQQQQAMQQKLSLQE